MSEKPGLDGFEGSNFGGANLYAGEYDGSNDDQPEMPATAQARAKKWHDILPPPSKRPPWLREVDPEEAAEGLIRVFGSEETGQTDGQAEEGLEPQEVPAHTGAVEAGAVLGQYEIPPHPGQTGEEPVFSNPATGPSPTNVGSEDL